MIFFSGTSGGKKATLILFFFCDMMCFFKILQQYKSVTSINSTLVIIGNGELAC